MGQSTRDEIAALRLTITAVEQNLKALRDSLAALELQEPELNETASDHDHSFPTGTLETADMYNEEHEELGLEEYRRYGRQMILPEFGLQGQPLR